MEPTAEQIEAAKRWAAEHPLYAPIYDRQSKKYWYGAPSLNRAQFTYEHDKAAAWRALASALAKVRAELAEPEGGG